MKTIMSAVLGLTLLAGASAVPASAETYITISAEDYARLLRAKKKQRHYVPRQIEYDANKLPVGSDNWWKQMDREGRGGRR